MPLRILSKNTSTFFAHLEEYLVLFRMPRIQKEFQQVERVVSEALATSEIELLARLPRPMLAALAKELAALARGANLYGELLPST